MNAVKTACPKCGCRFDFSSERGAELQSCVNPHCDAKFIPFQNSVFSESDALRSRASALKGLGVVLVFVSFILGLLSVIKPEALAILIGLASTAFGLAFFCLLIAQLLLIRAALEKR